MLAILSLRSWAEFWTVVGSILGALVIVAPFVLKRAWPWWRKRSMRREAEHIAIVGRPAILDPMTGKELSPAQPGIAQWMPATNDKIDRLTEVVERLANTDERVSALEHGYITHEERLGSLERAAMERIATRAENAAAMSMIEKLHPDPEG